MIICVVIIVFVCMRLFVVIYFRFLSINNMCTIMIVIHLLLCHWDSSERGLRYYIWRRGRIQLTVMTSSAASDSASAAAPVAQSVTTPPQMFGTISEFNPKSDNVSTYLERLELYFEVNQVEEDRKVLALLTVMGATAYDTLWSLLAPTPP